MGDGGVLDVVPELARNQQVTRDRCRCGLDAQANRFAWTFFTHEIVADPVAFSQVLAEAMQNGL